MGKLCAIYARTSTKQHQSTEYQINYLSKIAERNGWGIVEDGLYVDEGISGKYGSEKRPELNRLLKDNMKGKFDIVLTTELSRIARSTINLLKIAEELKERNTDLFIDNLSIDTSSPSGQLTFTILGACAEMERQLIRERVVKGLQNRKDKGLPLGRPFLLDKSKEYEINRLRQKDKSMRHIAKKVGVSPATISNYLNGKYGGESRC